MNNLAVVLAMQGLLEDAVKLAEETLEIQHRVEGPESIRTLRPRRTTWRSCDVNSGSGPRPGRCSTSRSRHSSRIFGPDHQDTLRALNGLGELLLDQRRPGGPGLFEEALKWQRSVLGPTSDETVLTMINLADAARLQGGLDEARKLAQEADALNRSTLGPEHPQTLFGLTILSSIARDQGRLDDARKGYNKALTALRRNLSARTLEVQRCMADYAWMLAPPRTPATATRTERSSWRTS